MAFYPPLLVAPARALSASMRPVPSTRRPGLALRSSGVAQQGRALASSECGRLGAVAQDVGVGAPRADTGQAGNIGRAL